MFIPTGWLDSDDVNLWSSPCPVFYRFRKSIQVNDLSFLNQMQGWKYSNEWNTLWNVQLWMEHSSHGTSLLNIFAIICIASVLLLSFSPFCWFLSYCMFFPTLSLHFLLSSSSLTFGQAEVHRLMSKGQEAVLTQKVTSNIVALAFSIQHFLAVGTLEKKVPGKEKHTKNTVSVCKGLGNVGHFLDHQSSSWF